MVRLAHAQPRSTVFLPVPVLLLTVLAALVRLLRALRVDPAIALRYE
jgi:ABC-type lipoprotein release transport system permease subunit